MMAIVTDGAIQAIRRQGRRDLTFPWFRETYKADNKLKASLAFGHAVIDSVAKLDQYLYTYGPMIESQWEHVTPHLRGIGQPSRWIDYGCGQGLAGLLADDLTRGQILAEVEDILLIEPSAPALARATAIYQTIAPAATVRTVCKRFDDLTPGDVLPPGRPTLHVFSNMLDVTGFDPTGLFRKTLRPGSHAILAVSHDRDFDGGTPRIEEVKAEIERWPAATIAQSSLRRFTCGSPKDSKSVLWLCQLEVSSG